MDFDAIPEPGDDVIAWPGHTFGETHGLASIPDASAWPIDHPVAARHGIAFLHAAGDVMLPGYSGFGGGLAELHDLMEVDPSEAVVTACYAVAAVVRRVPEVEQIVRREWLTLSARSLVASLPELGLLRDIMAAAIELNAGGSAAPAFRLMRDWDAWYLLQCALLLLIWMAWYRVEYNGIALDTALKMFFNAVVYYRPRP